MENILHSWSKPAVDIHTLNKVCMSTYAFSALGRSLKRYKGFFFISICISMEWNIFLCALKMRFNTKVPCLSLFNTYITALTWKTMMIWFFCHFSECLCLLLPHTASFGCLKEVTACFSWENFGQAHINNTSTGPRTVRMVRFLLFSP